MPIFYRFPEYSVIITITYEQQVLFEKKKIYLHDLNFKHYA